MQIINDYKKCPQGAKGSVIALGNFDGVHKGHEVVIGTAIDIAKTKGAPAAVMTFEPHPINLFKPDIKNYRLTTLEQKAKLLEELGVDYLFVINFNHDFSQISAQSFISDILDKSLNTSHIVIGYDYIFGHNKGGDAKMLEESAHKNGYGFTQVKAVGDGETFSSTAVRKALREGDLQKSFSILGRNYKIKGKVVKGDNRGKTIGFPTINVEFSNYLLPKSGVYAVKANIEGNEYKGVANLGVKPTFGGDRETLEVHIFDFDKDIYGINVEVEFLKYIREEKKFSSPDELVKQIEKDCEISRHYIKEL